MKISEHLRAAADYVRVHGFDYGWHIPNGECAQCFIGAIESTGIRFASLSDRYAKTAAFFLETIFDTGAYDVVNHAPLMVAEWNQNDAIAALEIAADIAECEGL